MKLFRSRFGSIGITYRTALLSWGVSVVTLLIFVLVIIPLQKRSFVENLAARATAIAGSLREVAAGAVLNGDFASAVDHCRDTILADKSIEYLVITRNDGFAVFHDRSGWRTENPAPKEWWPQKRETRSGIGVVPAFGRRVFHHSQPVEHIGLELGWIHVGLSVASYDLSVAAVSRRTGMLAGGCILFSLVVSALYAKRLVRPILVVEQTLQRVAEGDLSARAGVERGDELGSLANSVNAMTEALVRSDRMVQSVRFAAQQFLSTVNWKTVIDGVLSRLGQASGVCRVYVYSDCAGTDLFAAPCSSWTSGRCSRNCGTVPLLATLAAPERERYSGQLRQGETVTACLPPPVPVAGAAENRSARISAIWSPVFVEGSWWGLLGLESCGLKVRTWTDAHHDSIRAAANILGAAIARQRAQDALLEAKQTLEARVDERTRELREQVAAKERARAELAETQHQLVEVSRRMGMADVATGVLHNVGNVLNSVNVSVNLLKDRLKSSVGLNLEKVAQLLETEGQQGRLGQFLEQDPRGKRLPEYISKLSLALREERAQLSAETQALARSVEHIKEIVAMQQSYARVAGVVEDLPAQSLVDDALRIQEESLARHGIQIRREYGSVPLVRVDKHKVLQILVNLVRNARDAMKVSGRGDKTLQVRISANGCARVKIAVEDNGVGIAPLNLTRIFQHGFTTKTEGHGFGLHSGALAAREMGGTLQAASAGLGHGATFTLELPIAASKET